MCIEVRKIEISKEHISYLSEDERRLFFLYFHRYALPVLKALSRMTFETLGEIQHFLAKRGLGIRPDHNHPIEKLDSKKSLAVFGIERLQILGNSPFDYQFDHFLLAHLILDLGSSEIILRSSQN